jgi:hypothetical protein
MYKTNMIRICKKCSENEIEDEVHFLIKCSENKVGREQLVLQTQKFKNFTSLSIDRRTIKNKHMYKTNMICKKVTLCNVISNVMLKAYVHI